MDLGGWLQGSALLDPAQMLSREVLDLKQFVPMCKEAVASPMVDDPISHVLSYSGQLGKLFCGRSVDVEFLNHTYSIRVSERSVAIKDTSDLRGEGVFIAE